MGAQMRKLILKIILFCLIGYCIFRGVDFVGQLLHVQRLAEVPLEARAVCAIGLVALLFYRLFLRLPRRSQ